MNLVTCGAQATIPIVARARAASPTSPTREIVSTIASRSRRPRARARTSTSSRPPRPRGAGVDRRRRRGEGDHHPQPGRPADHDAQHRLRARSPSPTRRRSRRPSPPRSPSVAAYVPGYRLKIGAARSPTASSRVLVEVEGAGDFLPPYAGNLDIMTARRGAGRRAARRGVARTEPRAPDRRHDAARRLARGPPPVRASRSRPSRGRSTRPACGRSRSATATASAASSIQYGRAAHPDAELLGGRRGASSSGPGSRSRSCPAIGTQAGPRGGPRGRRQRRARRRRVCTEADIGDPAPAAGARARDARALGS